MADTGEETVTAALLVIGDEILSGRTKDKNIGAIADHCTMIGIRLQEVRVVGDVEDEIVSAATPTFSRPAASARRTTTSPPTASPRPSAFRSTTTPRSRR